MESGRRWRFFTITGSNDASRSRGTLISTGPTPVRTVLDRRPLRELRPLRPSPIVGVVAEVLAHLSLESDLQDPLAQLGQQTLRADQIGP